MSHVSMYTKERITVTSYKQSFEYQISKKQNKFIKYSDLFTSGFCKFLYILL